MALGALSSTCRADMPVLEAVEFAALSAEAAIVIEISKLDTLHRIWWRKRRPNGVCCLRGYHVALAIAGAYTFEEKAHAPVFIQQAYRRG